MNYQQLLAPINQFLLCPTPESWIEKACQPENLALLLTDHMVCELKAAQTAVLLIRRYVADKKLAQRLQAWLQPYEDFTYYRGEEPDFVALHRGLSKSVLPKAQDAFGQHLIDSMVMLIKEELHHFWQVRQVMVARNIPYLKITASRYAKGLLREVRTWEPAALVDKLICGAYIEARSCERFAALAPRVDADLQKFYLSLLRSEARHYQDYLTLAVAVSGGDISARVAELGAAEAHLILSADAQFRFHSGNPSLSSYN